MTPPLTEEELSKLERRFHQKRETVDVEYSLRLISELRAARAQKNAAYAERNRCVALMAKMAIALGWPSGVARHPEADTSWDDDWRTIVFIDSPAGQLSWHFHDSESGLLASLPKYCQGWDGHSAKEKYARMHTLACEMTTGEDVHSFVRPLQDRRGMACECGEVKTEGP